MLEDIATRTETPSILENAETKMMVEAWGCTLQALDQFTDQAIKGCFYSLRVKVIIRVIHHLYKENKISLYDEKIYESFLQLLNQYKIFIKSYQQNQAQIQDGKSKEILNGIAEVLSSEIDQLEENQQPLINPIKHEKDQIISHAKSLLIEKLKAVEERYTEKRVDHLKGLIRQECLEKITDQNTKFYIDQIQFIYEDMIEYIGSRIFEHYSTETIKGIESLNNFHLRQKANFYYEAVLQQMANLESMIKIQVQALEKELRTGAFEAEQQELIQGLLSIIRESYQYLGKEIEEFDQVFRETDKEQINILDPLNMFMEYIQVEGMSKYLNDVRINGSKKMDDTWAFFYETFRLFENKWDYFIQVIEKELEKNMSKKESDLYEQIQEQLLFHEKLAMEAIEHFQQFRQYHEAHHDELKEIESYEIIQGIYETMDIKIESLQESTEEIFTSLKDQLQQSVHTTGILNEEDVAAMSEKIFAVWSEYTSNIIDFEPATDGNEFLKTIFEKEKEEGIFFDIGMKQERKLQSVEEKYNKYIYQFLKESLLFEMSTYEEILFYSVSKLRENEENEILVEYIKEIDQLTSKLQTLLLQNHFELIQPKEHDVFDGKQHEVLMAEKQEGFEKGQIIKLMNTGYRYKDQIILRANVIAAK